ncbi:low-density lipoprotein receptor class A domain-containing protein 2 isoform X2 [Ascaphus truei]|uniref:low-density lipoprotein receptor class A domain-containing protein 2 isoform X2 n=1 Tax=Ascaphus truei TaxID=8439 RepID=UPI003F5A5EC8
MGNNKGKSLQPLSKLFVLLSFMMPAAYTIETVNLVDFCGQTIKGDGMIVNSHGDSRKYYFVSIGTDCRLTMQAAAVKDKVQFQFRFFLVYSLLRMSNIQSQTFGPGTNNTAPGPPSLETTRPAVRGPETLYDPCNAGSYVQFYDGKDQHSEPLGLPLCGKTIPRPVLSTGNYLTLRLVTRGQQPRVDFVGDFTSFRLGFNASECSAEPYFHCHNGKCIPASLVCDSKSIDNCGDGSDQSANPPANCINISEDRRAGDRQSYTSLLSLYIILGLMVGVALLFWCCWSPGWFIWRISACRFIPCCNSFCASCHLCTRSCVLKDKSRPGKVTPQNTATAVPV